MINFYNGDCIDFMRGKPDGYYDLAVVDPPYGGGGYEFSNGENRFGGRFNKYGITSSANSYKSHSGGGRRARYNVLHEHESGEDGRDMGAEVQPARGCL